jgi:EAL domain-containing protein (putative c-di-GMP-specific phosphodiesterase class I)
MTRLRQLGCKYLQGFHFGRPMPVEQIGDLLRGSQPRALAG